MNKDNAHLYLPLVQALADGKVIQIVDSDGEWNGLNEVSFCSKPDRYRIKPEPREWWQVRDEFGVILADYTDDPAAQSYADKRRKSRAVLGSAPDIYEVVHVREVTQ